MPGNIEEAILANYKKALENGNLRQAQKATVLATKLREMVELHGFEDTERMSDEIRLKNSSIFSSPKYTYNSENGTIILFGQMISLTETENRLMMLLSLNESTYENIKLIKRNQIKNFVWPTKEVTNNALRILIRRLRKKIEPNPRVPELLVNFSRKGYVFFGKTS